MTPEEKHITQLYIGYFNRAADPEGLGYWVIQANNGMTLGHIAASFAAQPEFTDTYAGLSNPELIDRIYSNLFDRVPDPEGAAYWLAQMDSGASPGELMVNVISGARGADRLLLENAAIVADAWTSRSTAPFDIAMAREAVSSINDVQPVTAGGITVNITDAALMPWQAEIDANIKSAWHQWEINFDNQSQIQIDVGFAPIPGGAKLASAAPYMEVLLASGYTQSGVAQEIITGRDPNGNMADGFINFHMTPAEMQSYANLTTVMAHELGHVLAYRTQLNNPNADHITNYDSFISGAGGSLHFDGPHAVAAYGAALPVPRSGSFNDFAHVDDAALMMYPYLGLYDFKVVGVVDLAVLTDIGMTIG